MGFERGGGVMVVGLLLAGALGVTGAAAANCDAYEKVAKMTAAKFAGEKTQSYAIISTEVVDAFPGAKVCTQMNSDEDHAVGTISGLYCRFPQAGAEASRQHATLLKDLKACAAGWDKTATAEANGASRVTYTAADSSKMWIAQLRRNEKDELEAVLRYEVVVALPAPPPAGQGK